MSILRTNNIGPLTGNTTPVMNYPNTSVVTASYSPIVKAASFTGPTALNRFVDISPWAKKVTISFAAIALSSSSSILIQLATPNGLISSSGSYISASYTTRSGATAAVSSLTGFIMYGGASTYVVSGHMTLINAAQQGIWCEQHSGTLYTPASFYNVSNGGGNSAVGTVPINRIYITTVSGTDTLSSGSIGVMYE